MGCFHWTGTPLTWALGSGHHVLSSVPTAATVDQLLLLQPLGHVLLDIFLMAFGTANCDHPGTTKQATKDRQPAANPAATKAPAEKTCKISWVNTWWASCGKGMHSSSPTMSVAIISPSSPISFKLKIKSKSKSHKKRHQKSKSHKKQRQIKIEIKLTQGTTQDSYRNLMKKPDSACRSTPRAAGLWWCRL